MKAFIEALDKANMAFYDPNIIYPGTLVCKRLKKNIILFDFSKEEIDEICDNLNKEYPPYHIIDPDENDKIQNEIHLFIDYNLESNKLLIKNGTGNKVKSIAENDKNGEVTVCIGNELNAPDIIEGFKPILSFHTHPLFNDNIPSKEDLETFIDFHILFGYQIDCIGTILDDKRYVINDITLGKKGNKIIAKYIKEAGEKYDRFQLYKKLGITEKRVRRCKTIHKERNYRKNSYYFSRFNETKLFVFLVYTEKNALKACRRFNRLFKGILKINATIVKDFDDYKKREVEEYSDE
jgi:hypothetical protein